jgi:hypothetical protein
MYNNSTASIRADINAFVEEAGAAEKNLIGGQIFPRHGVEARSGTYPRMKIGEGGLLRRDVTHRAPGASYNRISRKHSMDAYECQDRGLEEAIDDSKVHEVKSYFDLEVLTAKLVLRNMLLDFEGKVAAKTFDTGTFPNANKKVAYTEALIATCDFPYDLEFAIEELRLRAVDPNTIVMSQKLFNYVTRTKLLQDYIFGAMDTTKRKNISRKDIENTFSEKTGFELKLLVGSAGYDATNVAKENNPPVITPIWGNGHFWVGNCQGGDFSAGGAGRTLTWNKDAEEHFVTETYREEGKRGDVVRVRSNSIEKVVDETAGQLCVTSADF